MSNRARRPKLHRKARPALDLEVESARVVAPALAPVVGLVVGLAVVVPEVAAAVPAVAAQEVAEVAQAVAEVVPAVAEVVPAAARVGKGYLDGTQCNPGATIHVASVVRGQDQVARESS